MEVTFDRAKRAKTLRERGIDFTDAARVFDGTTVEFEDFRKDYGERRFIAFGLLAGRIVAIVYTPRGGGRRVISMRTANESERTKVAEVLGL